MLLSLGSGNSLSSIFFLFYSTNCHDLLCYRFETGSVVLSVTWFTLLNNLIFYLHPTSENWWQFLISGFLSRWLWMLFLFHNRSICSTCVFHGAICISNLWIWFVSHNSFMVRLEKCGVSKVWRCVFHNSNFNTVSFMCSHNIELILLWINGDLDKIMQVLYILVGVEWYYMFCKGTGKWYVIFRGGFVTVDRVLIKE